MSTVFASDADGWDDDYGMRQISLSNIDYDGNLEGYSGSPIHYLDIHENAEMAVEQRKYEKYEQKNYNDNIETVKKCIESGILLPPPSVFPKIVEKLKSLAGGGA